MSESLIYGVGINDSSESNKYCPYYSTWLNMLERCYSEYYHARQGTYVDCLVCDEWHIFSNFKKLMESQNWEGNDLDKDLLIPGNRLYHPDGCIFVPRYINNILSKGSKKEKDLPVGVSRHSQSEKYVSVCRKNGKYVYLGLFDRVEDAHKKYINFKSEYINEVALMQENELLKSALLRVSEELLCFSHL